MNDYMHMQIQNMLAMTRTFEQACQLAAMKNDGKIDEHEAKNLKKISAACAKFRKELDGLK